MDFKEAKWTDRYWPQIKFSFSLLPIWAGYVCINPHLVYRYFMKKTEEMVFLKTVYVWAEISPKHSVTRRLGKYFFHYLAICSQEIVKIIQSAAFFCQILSHWQFANLCLYRKLYPNITLLHLKASSRKYLLPIKEQLLIASKSVFQTPQIL